MVFTPGTPNIPITGITNAASLNTYAVGTVSITGTITAGDTVTITITTPGAVSEHLPIHYGDLICYTYTVVSTDTLASIVEALANLINGTANGTTPDPNVIATANIVAGSLFVVNLIARAAGVER